MQQSRYTDIQLLQQHLILKQLQELQRQQHLPQFCDLRQQNNTNLPFSAAKKAVGELPQAPLMNGTPVHDASQLFANWDERSASAIVHGWQNHASSSVEQGQVLHETGFLSQHLGASGGSLAASSRSSENLGNHLRGISPETANLFAKSSDYQPPTSALQSPTMSNRFLGDQPSVSSEQVCMSGGGYMDGEGGLVQSMFEKHPNQSCNSVALQGTLQPFNVLQTSTPMQDYNWKEEQAYWPGNLQKEPAPVGCSQELVPLDQLEKKILYNMDDNSWDASFGRKSGMGAGGFGSSFEAVDSFSSIQSGSWSALMQSAVAETSSGDTGLTEEWSGLTVQNADNSAANQPSVVDSVNQPSRWVDANSQSSFSTNSKPIHAFTSISSGAPVFQHSPMQSSNNQQENLYHDVSQTHTQNQKSVTLAGQWLHHISLQKSPAEGSQLYQQLPHLNAWSSHNYEHPELKINQPSIDLHFNLRPSHTQEQGEQYEATCKVEIGNSSAWYENAIHAQHSWRMAEGSQKLYSATANLLLKQEDPKNIYSSSPHNFGMGNHVANQQVTDYGQPNSSSQLDIHMIEKEIGSTDRNSGQVSGMDSLCVANVAAHEICPMSNVKDKFTGHDQGYTEQLKLFGNASNIINISKQGLPYDGGNLTKSDEMSSAGDNKCKWSASPDALAGPGKISVTTLRSAAERDWAQATNRLIEKVDNELGGRSKLRSKRRIILATQLMQQLLRAPPAWTLSVNAALTYDCLTYVVAKIAFGDACALTECPNSNKVSENVKVYLENGDGFPPKLLEDLTSKMKTLEDNLARLEKTPLISDMKVEFQELERYRVINRFAMFHVCPQQTSIGAAAFKPNPQRYFFAVPMAESPPELQCMPL